MKQRNTQSSLFNDFDVSTMNLEYSIPHKIASHSDIKVGSPAFFLTPVLYFTNRSKHNLN